MLPPTQPPTDLLTDPLTSVVAVGADDLSDIPGRHGLVHDEPEACHGTVAPMLVVVPEAVQVLEVLQADY